ncbi:polysaccharide pyruvyl transferase family protein [Rhizobium sp. CNPSo 4062]|uniref:polysaccharide pyruvyl transferase family protein n=1 Tax=Rhizobium sp. CNPSo 4062 TaxID=3021410 RepID=UPI00254AE74C|nr:polysaccharide pyruvyl transferase family protein [Rhizobium sp. CNPSo 4062]MDK4702229.1 polysaccharide pyruvyl transferase family protein [Rhizobium sp. CNPSo 4062]
MSDAIGLAGYGRAPIVAGNSLVAASGKLRAGVLTFHGCINYGSYWQARCLVEGLRSMSVDAVLLNHRSKRVDLAEWRCAFRPQLPVATAKEDYPLYRKKIRKFLDAISRLPLSAPFALENPSAIEDLPVVIVGSDEVWNLHHPWYGGSGLFFGEGLQKPLLSSYAASFGNFNSAQRLNGHWAEQLRNFSRISVRDLNSKRLLGEALGLEAELVLDPCLQFPRAILDAGKEESLSPYTAVYGHSFPAWFQRMVRDWADMNNTRLISIGYRNNWAHEHRIGAGPEEFARLIGGASAVVTNFFHGCVFALVNEKPLACVLSDYRSNKLRDLAAMVGIEESVISEFSPASQLHLALTEAPRPDVAWHIESLRHNSSTFLNHVLEQVF